MKIEIKLSQENPRHNDNLFILGWLEITDKSEKKIFLFKDTLCMIFLTLDNLTDFLFSKNNNLNWVGEDSGEVYYIKKNKGNLTFLGKNLEYICNENEFNKALFRAIIYLNLG